MDYEFINGKDENINMFETLTPIKYYQISGYPNPKTNYREIKIFDINEYNQITNVETKQLDKKTYKQILRRIQPQKYKVFATYDLDNIKYPSIYDIMLSRSSLLI